MVERKKSFWDLYPEQLELLKQRVLEHVPYGNILLEMNTNQVTRNALIGKARRMGYSTEGSRKVVPRVIIERFRPHLTPPPPKPLKPRIIKVYKTEPTHYITHMFDIAANQCRWIMGNPSDMLFCGCPFEPRDKSLSFCLYHQKVAHNARFTPGSNVTYIRNVSKNGTWS